MRSLNASMRMKNVDVCLSRFLVYTEMTTRLPMMPTKLTMVRNELTRSSMMLEEGGEDKEENNYFIQWFFSIFLFLIRIQK